MADNMGAATAELPPLGPLAQVIPRRNSRGRRPAGGMDV